MPQINCEISLILAWSENCVLTSKVTRDKFIGTGTDENPQFPEINDPTNATFEITDAKLYRQTICASCYFINKR